MRRLYIVYIKLHRGDPNYISQHVFATSIKDAIAHARGQGWIVQKAIRMKEE